MNASATGQRGTDIIIAFYRNADLVEPLFRSLEEVGEELACGRCSVVAINDSPDDADLRVRLREAVTSLSRTVPCRLIENTRNMGFVRSMNAAASEAIEHERDVLLLNSDTVVFPGAIAEIQTVAYSDPMIGFVSPRSNNATICSLPHDGEFRSFTPTEAHIAFTEVSKFLPRFHFVPTGVGFCLFIKSEVLEEFGLFDECYGRGYSEENDLIMRANRCGYQVALANHAFVYHIGESSFSASSSSKNILETNNAALLNDRFPEYLPNVMEYFESPQCEAERLLTGMLTDSSGRRDIVFDFSSVGAYHAGTFEAAKEILIRAAKCWRRFNIYVMTSEDTLRFHRLDEIERLSFVLPTTTRKFAAAFRYAQPFEYEQLLRMSRIAAVNIYAMLDPIAFDCRYLRTPDLETIWSAVFEHADGVIYISDFVGEQFRRRFALRPGLRELVSYLSLDYRDYVNDADAPVSEGEHILVVGNKFAHKHVPATVDELNRAFPREKIVAIGRGDDGRHNVISYTSGHLSERLMDSLLRGAKFVVFPSLYEGFGIPVVKSLAYKKPVLARSIPVVRAIKDKLGGDENLILYSSSNALIETLSNGFPVWQEHGRSPDRNCCHDWDASARQIGRFVEELVDSVSVADVILPRLAKMQMLQPKARGERSESSLQAASMELERSQRTIDDLRTALADKEAWTEEIYRSLSWRITSPLRRLGGALLRMSGK
jgi:GT2 family glycosyltransferase